MNDMISWQAICGDGADDQAATPVEIEHMWIGECGRDCRAAIALVPSRASAGKGGDAFRAQVDNANPVVVIITDVQLAAVVDLYRGRVVEPGRVGRDVIAVIARNASAGNGRNTALLGIDDTNPMMKRV